MKLSIPVATLLLSGFSLAFPAPAYNETSLSEPVYGPAYALDKRTHAAHGHASHQHTEHGSAKGEHSKGSKTTHKKTHCNLRSGKHGNKHHRRNGDDDDCGDGDDEVFIDFGNGWRTPSKKERAEARIKTPHAHGTAPERQFKSINGDFAPVKEAKPNYHGKMKQRPVAENCPPEDNKEAAKWIAENKMITPVADSMLFYSVVQQLEHEWAKAHRSGFEFMLDIIKDTATDWVKRAQGCGKFWVKMSIAATLQAHGDVHVLLPRKEFEVGQLPVWPKSEKNVGATTVWEEHEWPALLSDFKQTWEDLLTGDNKACRVVRWIKDVEAPEIIAIRVGHACEHQYPAVPAGKGKKMKYDWHTNHLTPVH